MNVRVIRWVAPLVVLLGNPSLIPAQSSAEPHSPSPGAAIATQRPDEREFDPKEYDIPELNGVEVARGSFLVNGKLPRALADYTAEVSGIKQHISIFENGIVSINMEGAGGTIRKKVLLPPDALGRYREALSAEALVDEPYGNAGPNNDKALLRIYREDGTWAERRFNPTLIQSATMAKPLTILSDLLRALSEDREVTNTLTNYVPRVGDQLISDDEHIYRVVRLLDGGNYVELMSTRDPLTLYVAAKDLNQYFVGKRRVAKRDE